MYIVSSSHRVSTVRSSHLEVFHKKRYSWKFRKIHRETLVLESIFFIKKETLEQVFSCEFYEILKSSTRILQNISVWLLLDSFTACSLKYQKQ